MKRTLPLNLVVAACLTAGLFVESASGQILFSAGSPYTQDFDSLASSGTTNTWTDNSTLPGWYASKVQVGAITTYRADTGTANTGAIYSYGVAGVNPITDRALGSIASGTPGNLAYGVRFQNDTTLAITNITISYTGEQWRNGGNTAVQTLAFSYFIDSIPILSSDAAGANAWVSFSALSFNSPTVGATAAALDGNAPIKIPPGTQPGTMFRLKSKGIKNVQGYGRGDLHIRINVEVPTHLSAAQKAKLQEFAELCNGKENPMSQSFLDKAKKLFH